VQLVYDTESCRHGVLYIEFHDDFNQVAALDDAIGAGIEHGVPTSRHRLCRLCQQPGRRHTIDLGG
jgi:hypothetical protein